MKATGAAHSTAPSKMILLDPDMDPDPAPSTPSAMRKAAPSRSTQEKDDRLPSARTLARFLTEAQSAVGLKGEVTVLLTNDAGIRRLNRQFRGKDKTTDVLSFPAEGIGAEEIAGDLAISTPTALKQSVEQGHPFATEIKILILHGLLHLAGYDHEADDGKMARRERLLRARLGMPQGLIERAEKVVALKGHGFSRAEKGIMKNAALAAEGSSSADGTFPQGLKPNIPVANRSARLKSCPDAYGSSESVFPQSMKSSPDTSTASEKGSRTQSRWGRKP